MLTWWNALMYAPKPGRFHSENCVPRSDFSDLRYQLDFTPIGRTQVIKSLFSLVARSVLYVGRKTTMTVRYPFVRKNTHFLRRGTRGQSFWLSWFVSGLSGFCFQNPDNRLSGFCYQNPDNHQYPQPRTPKPLAVWNSNSNEHIIFCFTNAYKIACVFCGISLWWYVCMLMLCRVQCCNWNTICGEPCHPLNIVPP